MEYQCDRTSFIYIPIDCTIQHQRKKENRYKLLPAYASKFVYMCMCVVFLCGLRMFDFLQNKKKVTEERILTVPIRARKPLPNLG